MSYTAFLPPPGLLEIDSAQLAETWRAWIDSWTHYARATKLDQEKEEIQVSTLLTCIGREARRVYKTFTWDTSESKNSIKTVISKFESYCLPRKNVPFERFKFNKRQQQTEESIDNYITELRQLASTCEFDTQTPDEVLRDRLIFGIHDNKVRERLLRCELLDLNRTIEICRAAETSQAQMRELDVSPAQAVHRISVNDSQSSEFRADRRSRIINDCRYCGKSHERNKLKCPAWGKVCSKCQVPNHFASKCRQSSRVNAIEETRVDGNSLIFALSTDTGDDHFASLQLENGSFLRFQLDTGAQCNVVPVHLYKAATGDSHLEKVTKSDSFLISYGGQQIPVIGCTRLKVKRRNFTCQLDCKLINALEMRPILGHKACIGMQLVTIKDSDALHPPQTDVHRVYCTSMPLSQEAVISKYGDVFDDSVGLLDGVYHIETDANVTPVKHAPRRIPMAIRAQLKGELDDLEKRGIIAKTNCPTEWVSSLVAVRKKDHRLRICLDPQDLNKAIMREHYPIPNIEDIAHRFHGAKVFSVLDAKNGFWHIALDDKSSYLTTFNTPYGRFRFLRLPFGISSAPEVFQRKMHEVVEGLNGVEVIADDFLVVGYGETQEQAMADHDTNLEAFLTRCSQKGLKLNREKLRFRQSEVPFIGHLATKDGLKVHPDKVEAIRKMPRPSDVSGVRRFLGMIQYLAKFVPNLSELTEPLRKLTQKDAGFDWNEEQEESFQKVKDAIANTPILRYYDVNAPVTVQCDASQAGLGAALLQNGQPVAFASRALTETEKRYAQIEKELLAIVWACEKFDVFLYGRERVLIESDHKPLENIVRKPLAHTPIRLQRMLLRLQRYSLSIKYKSGEKIIIADTLSRAYLPLESDASEDGDFKINQIEGIAIAPVSLEKISKAMRSDPVMQDLHKVITLGWPKRKYDLAPQLTPFWDYREELVIQEDLILKRDRLIIPSVLRKDVMNAVHEAHIGINGCLRRARETVFWPNMNAELKTHISNCEVCLNIQDHLPKEPLLQHETPDRPWAKVAADLCDFHGRMLLVVVDYFSNYIQVKRLVRTTSGAVVHALCEMFALFGIPDHIVTDNGPQFASAEFAKFCSSWNTQHITSSPTYAQSNGKAENAVRTIKRLFEKCREDKTSEFKALLNWRNTPTAGMSTTPSQRLMGRRCRTLIPTHSKLLAPTFDVTTARLELEGQKAIQKMYYDHRSCSSLTLML